MAGGSSCAAAHCAHRHDFQFTLESGSPRGSRPPGVLVFVCFAEQVNCVDRIKEGYGDNII